MVKYVAIFSESFLRIDCVVASPPFGNNLGNTALHDERCPMSHRTSESQPACPSLNIKDCISYLHCHIIMDSKPYHYTGQARNDIPRKIAHVTVDQSIKVVGRTFSNREHLKSVELFEGLEHIDWGAFHGCTSLEQILIPSTVKVIGAYAFYNCSRLRCVVLCGGQQRIDDRAFEKCTSLEGIRIPSTVKNISQDSFWGCTKLMNMELCDGLEHIGSRAFSDCTSLEHIQIPSTVQVIDRRAFQGCTKLRIVELFNGIERIKCEAFKDSTSLERVRIPSTVNFIHERAFKGCTSLVAIEFCEQIQQFVHEISLSWWNRGVSTASLRTYSFFAQCDFLARLDALKVLTWKENIHGMLQTIPNMISSNEEWDEEELYEKEPEEDGWKEWEEEGNYFESIQFLLVDYQYLQEEIVPLLELALWKLKMSEQSTSNIIITQMKLQCRCDSLSMGLIVIPYALSFL